MKHSIPMLSLAAVATATNLQINMHRKGDREDCTVFQHDKITMALRHCVEAARTGAELLDGQSGSVSTNELVEYFDSSSHGLASNVSDVLKIVGAHCRKGLETNLPFGCIQWCKDNGETYRVNENKSVQKRAEQELADCDDDDDVGGYIPDGEIKKTIPGGTKNIPDDTNPGKENKDGTDKVSPWVPVEDYTGSPVTVVPDLDNDGVPESAVKKTIKDTDKTSPDGDDKTNPDGDDNDLPPFPPFPGSKDAAVDDGKIKELLPVELPNLFLCRNFIRTSQLVRVNSKCDAESFESMLFRTLTGMVVDNLNEQQRGLLSADEAARNVPAPQLPSAAQIESFARREGLNCANSRKVKLPWE